MVFQDPKCINVITIKQKAEGRPQRTNKQIKSWLTEVPGSAAGIIVNLHISLKRVFKNIFLRGGLAKNNILAAAQLVKTSILARASIQCANNVFAGFPHWKVEAVSTQISLNPYLPPSF